MPQTKATPQKEPTRLARPYSVRIHVALEHNMWSPKTQSYDFTQTQAYAYSRIQPSAMIRSGELSLNFFDVSRGSKLLENEVLTFDSEDIKPDKDGYFKGARKKEFKVTVDIPDNTKVQVRLNSGSITYTAPGIAWATDGMRDSEEYSTMASFYLDDPKSQRKKGLVCEFKAEPEDNFLMKLIHGERSVKCQDIVVHLTKS
jgi:hypothetical protein